FKSDFPIFPISVKDFVLQKITEDIVRNWADTERRKKIKAAHIQGINLPPKYKNIIPLDPKHKKVIPNYELSSTAPNYESSTTPNSESSSSIILHKSIPPVQNSGLSSTMKSEIQSLSLSQVPVQKKAKTS
ncbi:17324_t:CDS:2, partial [Funneliformis geosporum]